jgi:hypothetical protein
MAKIDKNLTKLQKLALTINPLKNLTNSDIENLLQQSKLGNDVRLQYAYEEMEKVTPIFGICIERRISEILNRGWNIVPLIDGDESLETTTQKETLEKLLKKSDLKSGTGLTDAIRHLALYAFRGRSIVKPFIENGELEFTLLSNTNVVKDVYDKYYWIENGNLFFSSDDIS